MDDFGRHGVGKWRPETGSADAAKASGGPRGAGLARRRRTGRGPCAALLALAAAATPGQAAQSDPPVRLVGTDYALYGRADTLRRDHPWHSDSRVPGDRYFGRLAVEDDRAGGAGELVFAFEEVTGGTLHQYCPSAGGCDDLTIGVRAHTGQLFLYADEPLGTGWRAYTTRLPMQDFESMRAEVSVTDDATGLKVYREIVVDPPHDRPDCSGYPEDDPDRFGCLFLREERRVPPPAQRDSLRAALPELVQPAANYRLVFEEEFDGAEVDSSQGCDNRLPGLDEDVWSYRGNACGSVDADGVPCMNIEDGQLYLAKTGVCSSDPVNTAGKFSYRYGYMEARVAGTLRYPGYYSNYAMVQWPGGRGSLRHLYERYGVEVTDVESAAKYLGAELDFLEFTPGRASGTLITHQYVNAGSQVVRHAGVTPKRTNNYLKICHGNSRETRFDPPGVRHDGGEVTATLGMEWTPRGYRSWLKIDGLHDEFVLLEDASLGTKRWDPIEGDFEVRWTYLGESDRSAAFAPWTDGDRTLSIQEFAVAHVPAYFGFAAWGYPRSHQSQIKSRLKIDYVRIYQPENGYRDMEPVYR